MTVENPRSYVEARLTVPAAASDAVCNYIIDNVTSGLVLEEEEGSSEVGVIFYIDDTKADSYRGPLETYLAALVPDSLAEIPTVRERRVNDVDWAEKYRASVRPARVGADILIRPSWSDPEPNVAYDIVIEPKMAFGTGTHETTRSCLKAVRERFESGMRFLDMGTGSGILSILADKMGASYIKAVDYDVAAVDNCTENLQVNEVETPHEVIFGSIEKCDGDEPYQFVCVNIIKSTILPMLPRLAELTVNGGHLILSGLLLQDRDEIEQHLSDLNLTDYDLDRDNEWLTFKINKR